jgi:hypothetical protein
VAKKKGKVKTTIAFDPDVWEIIEDCMKQNSLDTIKDTVQTLIKKSANIKEERIRNKAEPTEVTRVINLKESTTLEAYSQYKEDVNKTLDSQPDLKPEQPKLPSIFEYFEEHPCHYRAIVKEKTVLSLSTAKPKRYPPKSAKNNKNALLQSEDLADPYTRNPEDPDLIHQQVENRK